MRRNYMYDRISKIPNITAVRPEGAFYILVNISQLGLSSQNFADRLLSKANVAVIPAPLSATIAPFASVTRPASTSSKKASIGFRISAGRFKRFQISDFRFQIGRLRRPSTICNRHSEICNATGYLALVLHAHLPFVRHPEHERFLEEDWLFEAITETYIPLLAMMQRLVRDEVPFKLTMTVTPTLCAMLQDQLLRERYVRHLDALIELAGREIERNRDDRAAARGSRSFITRTFRIAVAVSSEWNGDLLGAFRQLRGERLPRDHGLRRHARFASAARNNRRKRRGRRS